jgi:hypothetical protein
MIDSGAFSEVIFTPEGPRVAVPISDPEWRRRLAVYLHLASALHDKAMLVAPDQVGDQGQTLNRLGRYRDELAAIVSTGASLILPLQVGAMSHAEFFAAAQHVAGVSLIPAMPMRKAPTSADDLLRFVEDVKPRHIHLLGIGIDNRRIERLIDFVRYFSPSTAISMDSNRLRAVAGRHRPLTKLEAELRAEETTDLYGAVESSVFTLNSESLDYTDLVASPSLWSTEEQRSAIAESSGMTDEERAHFATDPDVFLQSPIALSDTLWIEHPIVSLELDCAWRAYVEHRIRVGTRSAAIVGVFSDSRICGQTSR